MKKYGEKRPVLVDTFGEKALQKTLGGNRPNSLVVIDKLGKVALWQGWSNPKQLRQKLEEMTGTKPTESSPPPKEESQPEEKKEEEKAKESSPEKSEQ